MADFGTLEELRQLLIAEDLRIRPLLKAILQTEAYRAGEGGGEETPTRRMLTPAQLTSAVEDLTGFRWWNGSVDMLSNDLQGYRVLAGGVDGIEVFRNQEDPGMTWALVIERLAQAGADHVVDAELTNRGMRRLFTAVTLSDPATATPFITDLEGIHDRLMGRALTAEERDDAIALWEAVETDHGAATAWKALLGAWLRDPEFVSY